MKTLARCVWAVAALGAMAIISGCASSDTRRPGRIVQSKQVRSSYVVEVIESSTTRKMSPQEMAHLRESVANYLESEGLLNRKGEYIVRVDFPTANPDDLNEWVVVKLTTNPASSITLIAAYPAIGADDYYPNDYFYDYGFSYWNTAYGYYDPTNYFPNDYRWFGPTHPRRSWDRRDHRPGDRDHGPDGTHARNDGRRDRDDDGNREPRPRNTGYTPRTPDAGDWRDRTPRGNNYRPEPDSGRVYTPRSEPTPRNSDFGGSRDHGGGSRDYSPPPRNDSGGSSYSPPPRNDPPPRSDPAPSVRYERNDAETANANNKDK